jgi:hypothetical protein
MNDEKTMLAEAPQSIELNFPRITQERYYEIIEQAYYIATDENFDVSSFIEKGLDMYENFDYSTATNSEISQREELMVLTGEVLGNRLSYIDHLDSVDEYEEYKSSLKALDPKQRSFCRTGISSSADSSALVLSDKELHAASHIDAQLMAILA